MGATVGSLLGSFIPDIWGAGQFSMWSIAFFMAGGVFGVWFAFRYMT